MQRASPDRGAAGRRFDVFLSYNSRDARLVEQVAVLLRDAGVQAWFDRWALVGGEGWQEAIQAGLDASGACAVFVGASDLGAWESHEAAIAIDRAVTQPGFRVIPVLLPGIEEPFDPNRLPHTLRMRTWVDLRHGVDDERAIARLLEAVGGGERTGDGGGGAGDVVPYRGLRVFEERDAEWYFGRDAEVQRLVEKLKAGRFVAVIGPSGSGKSSLVRAGVVPALRALGGDPGSDIDGGGGSCRVVVLRPGSSPLTALAAQLGELRDGASMQATLRELAGDERTLHLCVELALANEPASARVVVLVDQLEEIFTLCRDEGERRMLLATLLHGATVAGGRTVVIVTLRDDFYGRCAAYPEFAQLLEDNQKLVGAMTTDGMRAAIEQPARRAGLRLEDGLLDTIVADAAAEPGSLPLLEHALLELWQLRHGGVLTLAAYRRAGGVRGALTKRAEDTYQAFSESEQVIARGVLLRLTQPGEGTEDTRRRASRTELAPADDIGGAGAVDAVIARLVDARLLTAARDEHGRAIVDVAHEALIRDWPRLRAWIDADRAGLITHRRLTEAARDWEALNRDDGALYRGARLAGAQDWARDHASELGILERDFLAASNAIEQRELASARRRTRRLGVLAGGLAVLSAIVFGLALVAFSERNAVREQRDTAQADRLATDALSHLEADPGRSLESAMRSYTTKPTPLAEASLRAAASRATPQVVIRGHQAAVSGIAVARDGRHIASVDEDGTIRVHDWRARNEPAIVLRDTDGTVNAMTFTSDGRRLVILGNRLRVWNWREPHAAPVSARLPGEPGSAVAIEEGGRHVASVGADAAVRIWDLRRRPATPTVLRGRHTEQVDALEITKRWLASADRGGTVRVWDRRASGNKPIVFRARGRPSFSSLGFSPDGQHLAAATNEGTVLVWDLRRRRSAATTLHDIPHSSIGPVGATFGTTVGAAFSIDGRYVASMSLVDGTVHVWELRRPRLAPVALRGHEGYGAAAAFADNGHVVSAGGDGTVRVWDWRAQRTRVTELRGHQGFVTGVVFSADGRRLASGDLRGEIRVWDWRKPRLRSIVLPSDGMAVGDLALSDDSRRVASATYDGSGRSGRRRGTLRVWDLNMPRPVPIVLGERDVSQLTFSDDAEHLAAVDADAQTVLVWDLTAPRRRPAVMARSGDFAIKSIVFTDHGRRLVGASDGAVLVWDWRARTHAAPTIHRLPRESAEAVLALAGDGRHLARGLDDGTVHIIDWRAPARAPIVLRGALTAGSIAFAGDGLSIAAAADGLFVWDWRAPSVPPTVLAPSSGRLLAITPDGRYIASGGFDRAVHLYACEQCGDIEHVLRLARARAPIHLKG